MKKSCVLFSIFLTLSFFAHSQFSYQSTGYSTFAGTYTDLGTQGTVIDSTAYPDLVAGRYTLDTYNDVSKATPIGFTFAYNNRNFTHFFLATNGYIKLGSVAPPDPNSEDLYNFVTDSNLIYAFNCKLEDATGREYRVFTSGAPGSRICTIQFKNVRDFGGVNYNSINFQIRLYESGCKIEYVYGTFSPSANAATPFQANVGMWGQDVNLSFNLTKSSATSWSTPTALDGPYTGNRFNNRNNVLPDAGRTFQFICTPLPNNDARVKSIYTLSQLPRLYAFPGHRVGARIENRGVQAINNLPVILKITGANPFTDTATIVTLGTGTAANIYFDSIPGPGNTGTDTLRVSVPSDDNNTNNLATYIRYVNDTTFSYADDGAATGYLGFAQASGVMLVKYRTSSPVNVVRVKAHISNFNENVGKQVRGVIYNSLQSPLAYTSNITIQTGNLGSYLNMDFNPSVVVNGDFYVGMVQIGDGINAYYPLSYQQEGPPTRPGAYYTANIGGVGVTEDTSKGRFMIQAIIVPAPVPVTMQLFTAEKKGTMHELSWQVSGESAADVYVLERSERGVLFSELARIPASGRDRYIYQDNAPLRGLNYYRLRIVDAVGRATYSEIRMLRNAGKAEMFVFPNPVPDRMTVSYRAASNSQATITVRDVHGRQVIMRRISLVSGNNNLPLQTLNLAPGRYTVTVAAENEVLTQSFIKE